MNGEAIAGQAVASCGLAGGADGPDPGAERRRRLARVGGDPRLATAAAGPRPLRATRP